MHPTHATRAAMDLQAKGATGRYLAGEADALDALFRAIMPRIRAFFLGRTRDESDTDDLVQETLLRLYGARERFDARADVMPLVFTIARRLLIDRARARHRNEHEPLEPDLHSNDAGPDALAECQELAIHVLHSLSTLPPAHREAFELVRHEGLSVTEAAAHLKTTVNAVKLRTHRASVALHAELAAA
jgi:RNA polymerase sigma-70 factor, ECF subfamily